jgi:ribosomal protein L11 methyltransferase
VIVIEPSMGFGTGHHATTRLCLAHLQEIDVAGRTAVDVGTGSGVLAIAASRLGAARVLAIDDDEDAIQSARENLELNPGVDITLGVLDLRRAGVRPFHVVLANLTGALLVSAARALLALATPGGTLILSGFMESEEPVVVAAFEACEVERRSQEDEWVCMTLHSRRPPQGATAL